MTTPSVLHVRVLSRLFRRLFIEGLLALHRACALAFFGDPGRSGGRRGHCRHAGAVPQVRVVNAKPPFGGPEAVLAYLSRPTHRVAISNTRLISADAATVAFHWNDYRIKTGGCRCVMRLATDEFIHRFLIHVLPDGLQRTRHYGCSPAPSRRSTSRRSARCSEQRTPPRRPKRRPIPSR